MALSFEQYQRRRLISSYFSVVFSIFLVLFLLGALGLFVVNSEKISNDFKENIPMNVYFKDEANDTVLNQFDTELKNAKFVKSYDFITKDEAAKNNVDIVGKDFKEFLGFNPLQNSFDIHLKGDYVTSEEIKKIEEDKIKRIVSDRKDRLRPYVNPETFSEYELARLSESEFNEQLDKAIRESIAKKEDEKKIKELENHRLTKLQPYLAYVNSYDTYNLGTFSEKRFEEIFDKAKSDFKAAEKRNRPQLGSFSSIGFQSGEIAKYGFIYERGGRKTVGFRFTGRTSLTAEEDILNGTIVENKTEIELGPNFKIFKRLN